MRLDATRRFGGGAAVVILVSGLWACARTSNPLSPPNVSGAGLDISAETAFCADEVNRLRATVGRAPLVRSDKLDAYSAAAAAADGQSHDAHKYYRETGAGGGLVAAENEIPWWNLASFGSVHAIIQQGLAMQWAEGPGGGHYDNMTGPYTEIGCGVASINNEITVTQDFR
jgi:uncharacterized protein YkwD